MINRLFNYYKRKYKLNIKLRYSYIDEETLGDYDTIDKVIRINTNLIQKTIKKHNYFYCNQTGKVITSEREFFNFVLLHELKHAIDFKNKRFFPLYKKVLYDFQANSWASKRYKKGIK